MNIMLKDIMGITLEEAMEVYEEMGFAFNVSGGKLRGIRVENKEVM
ncbi:MAG: hypothetical protein ACRDB0_00385 [Paraclostridium sp.]